MNGNGELAARDGPWTLNDPLRVADPQVHAIIGKERRRQQRGLEMIASENFTSMAVLDCMASCLNNKYSEGQVNVRYYGGNEFIDEMETLAQARALAAFGLDPAEWGVNVQPYSGSPANFAVYTALVEPHGRIMGLDLPDGGHLTHGFFTGKKKISATSVFFESMPYKVDPTTGIIDYDGLERSANLFKPKMIVAGTSCYSRTLDYARFRTIADGCGALLMADMAHVAGIVAAGLIPSPFEHCDVVTTTTHKTLRGPRAGVIFYRKTPRPGSKATSCDFEEKISAAVFPGLQGGPHNHAIAGVAVAMGQASTDEFRRYQTQVLKNAKALAAGLMDLGYKVVTGGTDTHIVHVDMSSKRLSGAKAERILEEVSISCNKNTVPGDKSALNPSGVRLGTPPLASRTLGEAEMAVIVAFIDKAVQIALDIQSESGPKLVAWRKHLVEDGPHRPRIADLKAEVEAFAAKFPLPGHDDL